MESLVSTSEGAEAVANQISRARKRREGLGLARLLMVISSLAPLFVLWAIRGTQLIPDGWFVSVCGLLVVGPIAVLVLRIRVAVAQRDRRELVVGRAEDHRDHLLVYLFAVLLPFYALDIATWRDLSAMVVALGFIVFLFWHMNLHYMNLLFAIRGYRVFTIYPPEGGSRLSGTGTSVLITHRLSVQGLRISAYRLSDTVYIEID